jgi:DHA1 family multidrug resistance protein-like MFS transporter
MTVWKKNLILIWLAQFFGMTGFWFAMPFIPFYIQELGATEIADRNMWVAIYSAAGYMSVGIFAPIWGHVADRFGRRLMLLRANFCNALIIPLMAFAPNLYILVVLRFLMGVFSGTVSAAQTLVSSETPLEKRGFAIGMVSSGVFSGTMAGCFLGGIVVDSFGYKTAFIICGSLYLLSGLLILFGVRENFSSPMVAVAPRPKRRFFIDLDPLKTAWLILTLILFMGFARQFDTPFFPLIVQKIHGSIQGSATWTGIISSVAAVAGMLAGPILGTLADRISAPRVALLSAFFAGIFMLPQGLAESMGMLAFGRFFMIFFAGGLDPVFQIWLAKSTPDKIRGVIFGWALTAKCAGWVFAAGLSGLVATFIGLRWIYGAGCLFFWLLIPLIKYTAAKLEKKSA